MSRFNTEVVEIIGEDEAYNLDPETIYNSSLKSK